jgi:nucleotide-binding universal stress UspA family protein
LPAREAIVLHVWKSLLGHTLTGAAMLHAPLEEIRESAGELGRVLEESVRAITEDGLARALEHGLRARPMTVESVGSVAQTVMRVADESDAAVVVLGRTGHGAIAGALLGSVSASLMHGSDRPVLFTP